MPLHMIKLCVGADTVEDLLEWQRTREPGDRWIMRTRQTPKRAAELIDGGSLYRVVKGVILCRQPIPGVDPVGGGVTPARAGAVDPHIGPGSPIPRPALPGRRLLP